MTARIPVIRSIHVRRVVCRGQNFVIAAAERIVSRRARRRCPCCGWSGLYFRSFAAGEYIRHDATCPGCWSLERHRALTSFYRVFFRRIDYRPKRLIHFAPEPCLAATLASLCDRYETSAYGETSPADYRLDLTSMSLADQSCDAIVLNHVLDCMPDDRSAVREMFRILSPGGVALAVVAFESGTTSREIPVPSNNLYRVYGSEDAAVRFAPFRVDLADAAAGLSQETRHLQGIPATVPVVVMRKPVDGRPAA